MELSGEVSSWVQLPKKLYQVRNDAGNANALLVDFSARSYNVGQDKSLTNLFL